MREREVRKRMRRKIEGTQLRAVHIGEPDGREDGALFDAEAAVLLEVDSFPHSVHSVSGLVVWVVVELGSSAVVEPLGIAIYDIPAGLGLDAQIPSPCD